MTLDVLVEEACRRSALLWVAVPGAPSRAAWHVWVDGSAYLVTGPGEQQLPELAAAVSAGPATVDVVVRSKDTGGRLLRWSATATRIDPAGEAEAAAVKELSSKRLNAVDVTGQVERWARTATVVRLRPTGDVPEHPAWDDQPATLTDEAMRAVPRESTGTTATWRPWHLGRRRRRTQA